tara:strand:- start:438 stop:614 length:177 start_codon:yes stop_codon:yes gene_type:complete
MIRCPRCNLTYGVEIREQPKSNSFIPNVIKLKERAYLNCRSCGYNKDIENYKNEVLTK